MILVEQGSLSLDPMSPNPYPAGLSGDRGFVLSAALTGVSWALSVHSASPGD